MGVNFTFESREPPSYEGLADNHHAAPVSSQNCSHEDDEPYAPFLAVKHRDYGVTTGSVTRLKGHCIEFKYYADGIHCGLTPPG